MDESRECCVDDLIPADSAAGMALGDEITLPREDLSNRHIGKLNIFVSGISEIRVVIVIAFGTSDQIQEGCVSCWVDDRTLVLHMYSVADRADDEQDAAADNKP